MEKKPSTLKRMFSFFKDRKKTVVFLLVIITISQVASLVVPFITKDIIDTLTGFLQNHGALPWKILLYFSLSILVMTLLSSILQSVYNYYLFLLATKTEDKIRSLAFENYLDLHSLFHHNSSSGQIIGRIELWQRQ